MVGETRFHMASNAAKIIKIKMQIPNSTVDFKKEREELKKEFLPFL